MTAARHREIGGGFFVGGHDDGEEEKGRQGLLMPYCWERKPHYREGAVVCCPNDHPMYRLTRDIFKEDMIRPSQFESIDPTRITPPVSGMSFQKCPECGESWVGPRGPLNVKESEDR